ncbi:MAG: hypothetical protein WAK82_25550 [Streptosporangiaceae bacterium]
MAWPLPELDVGAEPELKPPELELPELELPELELEEELEPEDPEFEEDEPEPEVELEPFDPELVPEDPVLVDPEPEPDEPVPVEAEPEEALVLWVDPGRANATAPAATTLARPTAVVVDRTRARPRSLAAMASRMPYRRSLLM